MLLWHWSMCTMYTNQLRFSIEHNWKKPLWSFRENKNHLNHPWSILLVSYLHVVWIDILLLVLLVKDANFGSQWRCEAWFCKIWSWNVSWEHVISACEVNNWICKSNRIVVKSATQMMNWLRATAHTSQGPLRAFDFHPKVVSLTWFVEICVKLNTNSSRPWQIIYSLPYMNSYKLSLGPYVFTF